MTALFPEVAAILADPERPAKLAGLTLDSLRTAGVSRVQRGLAPRALLHATDRVLNHIPLAQERATFFSGLGNGSLWLAGYDSSGCSGGCDNPLCGARPSSTMSLCKYRGCAPNALGAAASTVGDVASWPQLMARMNLADYPVDSIVIMYLRDFRLRNLGWLARIGSRC